MKRPPYCTRVPRYVKAPILDLANTKIFKWYQIKALSKFKTLWLYFHSFQLLAEVENNVYATFFWRAGGGRCIITGDMKGRIWEIQGLFRDMITKGQIRAIFKL